MLKPASTSPRVVISRPAFARAAQTALAAGGAVADLRGDAYGHGAREAAQVLLEVGAAGVLVDEQDAAHIDSAGLRVLTTGEADIDPALLYGFPGAGTAPSLSLLGHVMSTKPLQPGDGVSYGYTHRAETETTVALVTGGYAQGIVRALGNHAEVLIDGSKHPIIGRVAMDVCVVDVRDAQVVEGAEVLFLGGTGVSAQFLANWVEITGLTAGELLAVVGNKAVRIWRN